MRANLFYYCLKFLNTNNISSVIEFNNSVSYN